EDGIRYGHVTGVQTCALPISRACERRRPRAARRPLRGAAPCERRRSHARARAATIAGRPDRDPPESAGRRSGAPALRERRALSARASATRATVSARAARGSRGALARVHLLARRAALRVSPRAGAAGGDPGELPAPAHLRRGALALAGRRA